MFFPKKIPDLRLLFISCIAISIITINCKDELVQTNYKADIYQVKGCKGSALGKFGSADSCFKYSFSEKLILEFCVTGNCCPDSNRFELKSSIDKDTISIEIKDIAPNLCRCMCKYYIHAEFEFLSYNNYSVKCMMEENEIKKILYLTDVKR
jgi:hypothetical protein